MPGVRLHQKLPNNWEEREKLRNKGQFWTPQWVAEAMVEYVLEESSLLFDPATGEGVFYQALKNITASQTPVRFHGIDIDQRRILGNIFLRLP